MAKFTIVDWTHRGMFSGRKFDSFRSAWDHIYAHCGSLNMSAEDVEDFCETAFVLPMYGGEPIGFGEPWPDLDALDVQLEPDDMWHQRLLEHRRERDRYRMLARGRMEFDFAQ